MKAITIHQPWASLVEHGYKAIETRGWRTHHRGPVAICSGKTWGAEHLVIAASLFGIWGVSLTYPDCLATFNGSDVAEVRSCSFSATGGQMTGTLLPLGCCLCVADLWGCLPVEQVDSLSPQERAMGNYSPGRFAWLLRDVRRVAVPFFVTGKQGLWELNESWHAKQLAGAA